MPSPTVQALKTAAASYVRQIRGHGAKEVKPGDLGIIVILAVPGQPPQWASNLRREDVRRLYDQLAGDTAIECMVVQPIGG